MDPADMNTRLQLSDTSSIPPMHCGFLLSSRGAHWDPFHWHVFLMKLLSILKLQSATFEIKDWITAIEVW